MANKTKSKSLLEKMWRIKWWLLSIFTVLFLLFALFFPLNNYYVELPGGAFDTKEVLTVNKKADDSKGSYNFVAVAQTKATLALMLYAQFNDFAKLQRSDEYLQYLVFYYFHPEYHPHGSHYPVPESYPNVKDSTLILNIQDNFVYLHR